MSVFSAKILSWANTESFKLLKQITSIPAPLRHKKSRRLWEVQRKINGNRIRHPSTRHKRSGNFVMLVRWLYAYCYMNKHTVIQSANHTVKRMIVWSIIHACSHLYVHLYSRLYMYSCIQSSSRPIDISAIRPSGHSIVRSAKSSYGRTLHPVSTYCCLWLWNGSKRHCPQRTESQNRSVSLSL